MRIPESDVTYIVPSVYLLTLFSPIQLKTFELELDFAEYIHYTDVLIADFCWTPYTQSTG